MFFHQTSAGIPNGKLFARQSMRISTPPSTNWVKSWSASSIVTPKPIARRANAALKEQPQPDEAMIAHATPG